MADEHTAETKAKPIIDMETGRLLPMTDEDRRAHAEAWRRALKAMAEIRDETDTDEVWERFDRIMAGEYP
jgi:hypothetical protein